MFSLSMSRPKHRNNEQRRKKRRTTTSLTSSLSSTIKRNSRRKLNDDDNDGDGGEGAFLTPAKQIFRGRYTPEHSPAKASIGREERTNIHVSKALVSQRKQGGSSTVTIQLPSNVLNVFSSANLDGLGASGDFLRVYGWEHITLLKHVEDQEFDNFAVFKDKDLLQTLVASGIVPRLEKRKRQHTTWFDPHFKPWNLSTGMAKQSNLSARRRQKLVQRLANFKVAFKHSTSTFFLSVALMNKSLACTESSLLGGQAKNGSALTYRELCRLTCAWYWLAAKMEEVEIPNRHAFSSKYFENELIEDEARVCKVLQFRLHHITPVSYEFLFLQASQESEGEKVQSILRDIFRYFLELGCFAHELVSQRPSLTAAASLWLARAILAYSKATFITAKQNWNDTLKYYTGYAVSELNETIRILCLYHKEAEAAVPSLFPSSKASCVFKAVFERHTAIGMHNFPPFNALNTDSTDGLLFKEPEIIRMPSEEDTETE